MAKTRSPAKSMTSLFSTLDMNSPSTAERFREVALIYTEKSKKSKQAAIDTLKREHFLTKTGKVARVYEAKR